ncbi:roadblock/LC7 domain-containing protein [Actinomadura sp. WMMB 499]|uniref:roadblock/LC7 domain-containing protein n=1 Tax=Actinomadura sp. WMMB 499 TaxID=1219491 RepID=UPI0020C81243|nr:roadblock/LC7 domain-containing protein [Actinomadura sp. WMMB 499]
MTPETRGLVRLLDALKDKVRGVRHVLVLSRDGLRISHTDELGDDRADQLAALASGVQSLSLSASAEFGDGGGAAPGRSMVEFHGGVLLIIPAGQGAHLAVVTEPNTDVGLAGRRMEELARQIRGELYAAPRRPEHDART